MVAAAVTGVADEEGLEPIDLAAEAGDPLAMLSILSGPHVTVSGEDHVTVAGLASLDIADADEWGAMISAACECEVIALEAVSGGVRAYTFDGGEPDETIDVPLDRGGRTRAPALAAFAVDDAGRRELEAGVGGSDVGALLAGLLRCLGAEPPSPSASALLAFHDPLGDEDAAPEPALVVEALTAASLEGKVDGEVNSLHGNVFGVTVTGVDAVSGIVLTFEGDALSVFRPTAVDVCVRTGNTRERRELRVTPEGRPDGALVVTLPDAFVEPVEDAAPVIDPSDMFGSMQRLMSAGDEALLNTVSVNLEGVGLAAGEGALTLRASAVGDAVASGEASIPVRVGH